MAIAGSECCDGIAEACGDCDRMQRRHVDEWRCLSRRAACLRAEQNPSQITRTRQLVFARLGRVRLRSRRTVGAAAEVAMERCRPRLRGVRGVVGRFRHGDRCVQGWGEQIRWRGDTSGSAVLRRALLNSRQWFGTTSESIWGPFLRQGKRARSVTPDLRRAKPLRTHSISGTCSEGGCRKRVRLNLRGARSAAFEAVIEGRIQENS